MAKVTKEEKSFIRAFVKMLVKVRGLELEKEDVGWIESELKDIIYNCNCDHRWAVKQYVEKLVEERRW